MPRKDVETVSLSFLDLLSCALGAVILLMLLFTLKKYGEYSHRKSLVLYADIGSTDEVEVFAVNPTGEEFRLSETGSSLLYMVQERPEFGDWQIVAKRSRAVTDSNREEKAFDAVVSLLGPDVDSSVSVTNWMPFPDAFDQARKSAMALSSGRRKKTLDANTLKRLQTGVFSLCSAVNRGREINDNIKNRERTSLEPIR